MQERIQDKAIQKAKSVAASLPHRNVALETYAGLYAQAIMSLSASHKLSKVCVKGH